MRTDKNYYNMKVKSDKYCADMVKIGAIYDIIQCTDVL